MSSINIITRIIPYFELERGWTNVNPEHHWPANVGVTKHEPGKLYIVFMLDDVLHG